MLTVNIGGDAADRWSWIYYSEEQGENDPFGSRVRNSSLIGRSTHVISINTALMMMQMLLNEKRKKTEQNEEGRNAGTHSSTRANELVKFMTRCPYWLSNFIAIQMSLAALAAFCSFFLRIHFSALVGLSRHPPIEVAILRRFFLSRFCHHCSDFRWTELRDTISIPNSLVRALNYALRLLKQERANFQFYIYWQINIWKGFLFDYFLYSKRFSFSGKRTMSSASSSPTFSLSDSPLRRHL